MKITAKEIRLITDAIVDQVYDQEKVNEVLVTFLSHFKLRNDLCCSLLIDLSRYPLCVYRFLSRIFIITFRSCASCRDIIE